MGRKLYVGDSVYAEYEGGRLILTTENGLPRDPSNKIILEPQVLGNLIEFWKLCVSSPQSQDIPEGAECSGGD